MNEQPEQSAATRPNPLTLAGDLRVAVAFLTRLPFHAPAGDAAEAGIEKLSATMGLFPLVGALVGGIGAGVFVLARLVLPALVSAPLALAAMVLATGGLHEDGLADIADGFGGGRDRERKLAIMRDSRLGTYGVLALILAFAMRASALVALDRASLVAGALVAAHALSRAAIPVAMRALSPARTDGLGAAAGRPSMTAAGFAATLALVIAALVLPAYSALAAVAGAVAGAAAVALLAQRQVGGQTGDVLGAIEQAAETFALLGVVAAT